MLVSLYKFKIIKLVLRNMWGMFIRMNVETESRLFIFVLSRCLIASRCFTWNVSLLSAEYGSLFSCWENLSTPTGGRSERTCYLACLLLFLETSHAWGGWISFMEEWFHVKHDRMVELQEIAFRVRCLSPIGCWGLVFHVKREGVGIEIICLDVFVGFWGFDVCDSLKDQLMFHVKRGGLVVELLGMALSVPPLPLPVVVRIDASRETFN